MIQCRDFIATDPVPEINQFFLDNPNFRYVNHTTTPIVRQSSRHTMEGFYILVFYQMSFLTQKGSAEML
jgi:hypothetical protein